MIIEMLRNLVEPSKKIQALSAEIRSRADDIKRTGDMINDMECLHEQALLRLSDAEKDDRKAL